MRSRLLRRSRNTLALAACAAVPALACTFPAVIDYEDGGASEAGAATMETPACPAPASCAADAQKCSSDALKEYDACVHPCSGKPGDTCLATCNSALSAKLSQCNGICQSCAQSQGCANAASSCKMLVGG